MKPDVPVYLSFDHSLGAETVGTTETAPLC